MIFRVLFMFYLLSPIVNCYSQTLEAYFQKNDTIALKKIIAKSNPSTLLQTHDSVALFLTDIVSWFVAEYKSDRTRIFRVRDDGLHLPGERLITVGGDSILTGYMNGDDFEIDKILKRTGRVMNGLGLSNGFANKKKSVYNVHSKSGGIKINNSFSHVLNTFLSSDGESRFCDGTQRAGFLGSYLSGLRQSNMGQLINGTSYFPWHFHPIIIFEAVYFNYRHTMALVVFQYANFKQECYLKRNDNGEWVFDEKGIIITYC